MYRSKKIGVSIPCLNEEGFIGKTIDGLPDFMDKIYVVDDGSTDGTAAIVKKYAKKDKRVILLKNEKNMGNGYSVVRGFKQAIEDKCDIVCIVAGDNQCRLEYLPALIDPVVDDLCDYAKANRFVDLKELQQMPKFRKAGNIFMSFINKFATGYYSVFDPLNSYSATRASTLKAMDLDAISHRYDFENSFMLHFYLVNARVRDIAVPARYEGEQSDIKIVSYVLRTTRTLVKSFFLRMYYKYILFSFHPVALFLITGSTLFLFGLVYGAYIIFNSLHAASVPASTATVMIAVVPFILGFQLLLQAIVLDIQNEPK